MAFKGYSALLGSLVIASSVTFSDAGADDAPNSTPDVNPNPAMSDGNTGVEDVRNEILIIDSEGNESRTPIGDDPIDIQQGGIHIQIGGGGLKP